MRAKQLTVLIAYDSSEIAGHAIDEAARIFPGVGAVVLVVWPSVRSVAGAGRLALADDVIAAGVAGVDEAAAQQAAATAAEGTARPARRHGRTARHRLQGP